MSATVNPKNQVTNSGFTYDSGGNLTADGTYTYTWNGENRLATVNGVTYTYDGDGKRVMKSNGTIYWYDLSGNVIEETDANGNLVDDYVFGAGMRLARRDASGNIYTYYNDPLGSARYIQGPGNTHAESDYYPFGGERVISNNLATTNNYKFTGMERDGESGLDHTLNRQFSSGYGRWLSLDSMGGDVANPQSLNRYAYVLNNPTTLTDPLGLDGSAFYLPALPFGSSSCSGSGSFASLCASGMAQGLAAYQAATVGATATPKVACMAGEYGCDSSSSFGEDIYDALGVESNFGGPTGSSVTLNQQGNLSASFNIAQWMAEAGIDKQANGSNPLFGCVKSESCTSPPNIAVDGAPSATTGALTAGLTGSTYGVNFPPATKPLGFGSSPQPWMPKSPWDPPMPPFPLPGWPQPLPSIRASPAVIGGGASQRVHLGASSRARIKGGDGHEYLPF